MSFLPISLFLIPKFTRLIIQRSLPRGRSTRRKKRRTTQDRALRTETGDGEGWFLFQRKTSFRLAMVAFPAYPPACGHLERDLFGESCGTSQTAARPGL